jgi:hypothetical protein
MRTRGTCSSTAVANSPTPLAGFYRRPKADVRRYTQGYAAIRAHIAISSQSGGLVVQTTNSGFCSAPVVAFPTLAVGRTCATERRRPLQPRDARRHLSRPQHRRRPADDRRRGGRLPRRGPPRRPRASPPCATSASATFVSASPPARSPAPRPNASSSPPSFNAPAAATPSTSWTSRPPVSTPPTSSS